MKVKIKGEENFDDRPREFDIVLVGNTKWKYCTIMSVGAVNLL